MLVANVPEMYDALERNGLFLPKLTSKICTRDFLRQIKAGTTYCPRYADLKLLPCPKKPSSNAVQEALIALIL